MFGESQIRSEDAEMSKDIMNSLSQEMWLTAQGLVKNHTHVLTEAVQ